MTTEFETELINFLKNLNIGEKCNICGIPFIKVNNNKLLDLRKLYETNMFEIKKVE